MLRTSLPAPLARLPSHLACTLAEAAAVVLNPGSPLFLPLGKHLLRRATLGLQEVPLVGRLLLSGGPGHGGLRRWALRLLLAGLRDGGAARLCRRRHLVELAMALADSPVADPEAAALALAVVCRAAAIPRAARELAKQSGLVAWLAAAAARGMRAHLEAVAGGGAASWWCSGGSGGDGPATPAAAAQPLAALRGLLQLRAVMRGSRGSRGGSVLPDLVAGCRKLASLLSAAITTTTGAAAAAAPLWAELLPLVAELQASGAVAVRKSGAGQEAPGALSTDEAMAIAEAARAAAAAVGGAESERLHDLIAQLEEQASP